MLTARVLRHAEAAGEDGCWLLLEQVAWRTPRPEEDGIDLVHLWSFRTCRQGPDADLAGLTLVAESTLPPRQEDAPALLLQEHWTILELDQGPGGR